MTYVLQRRRLTSFRLVVRAEDRVNELLELAQHGDTLHKVPDDCVRYLADSQELVAAVAAAPGVEV